MTTLRELALSKLTITSYQERARTIPLEEMQVMFNPSELNLSYDVEYYADSYLNSSISANSYRKARPSELKLELLFDSSHPGGFSIRDKDPLTRQFWRSLGDHPSVTRQLTALQMLCCERSQNSRETPYLKVTWGGMRWYGEDHFDCRAVSLQVKYSRFNRKGEPIRATAILTLSADSKQELLDKTTLVNLANKQGSWRLPDVPFLPMIVGAGVASYGVSGAYDYLDVARANNLDSLDAIEPGDTLVVPSETADKEVTP